MVVVVLIWPQMLPVPTLLLLITAVVVFSAVALFHVGPVSIIGMVPFDRRHPEVSSESALLCPVVYAGEAVVTAPRERFPVWPEVVDPSAAAVGWFALVAAPA